MKINRFGQLVVAVAALVSTLAYRAHAHPHVWVVAGMEIVLSPDGALIAIRHHWTFDETFSTAATQGLDRNQDGQLSREELQNLAAVNMTALQEFDYYTQAEINGRKSRFLSPVDFGFESDGRSLTLHFTLPLQSSAKIANLLIEIGDLTNFVDFSLRKDDVQLTEAPFGCMADVVTTPRIVSNLLTRFAQRAGSGQISIKCPPIPRSDGDPRLTSPK